MKAELACLREAMLAAGEAILEIRARGFSVQQKPNADVLTEADLAANQVLKNALLSAFPKDGWLSEETADTPERLQATRVWIVDPIDGTREFIQGIPEYAISVALIESGEPVLSSVYNPETRELFYAIKNKGAFLNDQPIRCRTHCEAPYTLLASRSEFNRGEWAAFMTHEIKVVGSIAYKLALVAAGRADATFSLGPKSEWDIAAGVLLVTESQGYAGDCAGKPFQFNQPTIRVKNIAASSHAYKKELLALLEQ